MSRPRPASSRGATPRPRKIAGRSLTVREAPDLDPDLPPEKPAEKPGKGPRKRPGKPGAGARHHPPALLASARVTRVLIGVLAALALVLAGLTVWLLLDDDPATTVARDGAGSPGVTVPSGRPVVANTLAVQGGVEAAAKATQELFSIDYSKYDAELERAVELMTTQYEKEYRKTIGDVKDEAVAQRLVVQSNVVAQGVVRANRTELEALVFLNQVTQRTREGKPETVATPFKVLVTMVHTDQGWLVDGLETDGPERPETD